MKHLLAATCAAVLVGAALSASSADSGQQKPMLGMGGMHSGSGMQMMPGMQGMMDMMQGCPMMGSGAAPLAGLVPQLPRGNEKLQAQMWAEIMQKAGEIAAKYAAQAK